MSQDLARWELDAWQAGDRWLSPTDAKRVVRFALELVSSNEVYRQSIHDAAETMRAMQAEIDLLTDEERNPYISGLRTRAELAEQDAEIQRTAALEFYDRAQRWQDAKEEADQQLALAGVWRAAAEDLAAKLDEAVELLRDADPAVKSADVQWLRRRSALLATEGF